MACSLGHLHGGSGRRAFGRSGSSLGRGLRRAGLGLGRHRIGDLRVCRACVLVGF